MVTIRLPPGVIVLPGPISIHGKIRCVVEGSTGGALKDKVRQVGARQRSRKHGATRAADDVRRGGARPGKKHNAR